MQSDTETVQPISVQPPLAATPNPPAYGQPGIPNASPFPSASPFATANPYNTPQPRGRSRSRGKPHRGGLVLGLGIAAFFCPLFMIPGVIALILGISDLRAMKAGRMDNEGHGLTIAGTIIGGIATALGALIILFYALIVVVAITAG